MSTRKIADYDGPDIGEPLVESPAFLQPPIAQVERDTFAHSKFVFVRRLLQVARLWRTALSDALRPTSDVQSGWQTLFWLSLIGQTSTQRELADRVGIKESTLARALDALEKQGLVRREVVENNRRAKTITLTAAAAPVIGSINERAMALRENILADVDPADLEACLRVLAKVRDSLLQYREDK